MLPPIDSNVAVDRNIAAATALAVGPGLCGSPTVCCVLVSAWVLPLLSLFSFLSSRRAPASRAQIRARAFSKVLCFYSVLKSTGGDHSSLGFAAE